MTIPSLPLRRLPGMQQGRSLLGVSIESGRLAVAVLHRKNGHGDVVASCEVPLTPDQLLADPERAGRDLAACLQRAGIRERRCAICLPPAWALTAGVPVPPVAAEDLRGYLELQAEREFPVAPGDLQLAYSRFLLPDGASMATLAAVPTDRLDRVRRLLAAAGCRAVSISLGIDACLPDGEAAGGSLNFIANGTHVDVVTCAGGGVVDMRSISGSPVPAGDVAVLGPEALQRELRITLGRLPEALRGRIDEGRFLGRAGSAHALREAVEPSLRDMGIHRLEGGVGREDGEAVRYGAAAVAAARHLYGRPATFEFVLPRTSRVQALLRRLQSRRNRIATVALPALLVLAVLVLAARSQYLQRLERRWGAVAGTVAELELLQERVRQFRPWFSDDPESLEVLAALTDAFPAGGEVWARRVELEENRVVTCAGMARDHAALMAVLDRLQAQPGVDDVQIQQVRGERLVQFAFSYTWRSERRD